MSFYWVDFFRFLNKSIYGAEPVFTFSIILRIAPSEIEQNIEEVYVTTTGGTTVWLVGQEKFVQKVFRQVAQVKNEDYSFIPHIPAAAKARRKAIETKLNDQRKKDTDQNINIHICLLIFTYLT